MAPARRRSFWSSTTPTQTSAPTFATPVQDSKELTDFPSFFSFSHSSWSPPKELKPLSAKAIDEFLENKGAKNSALATAYATAKNPEQWEAEQTAIQENLKAGIVDEDDATASGSKKRKNKASDSGTSKKAKAEPKKKVGLIYFLLLRPASIAFLTHLSDRTTRPGSQRRKVRSSDS